jgi:hypothetical protein
MSKSENTPPKSGNEKKNVDKIPQRTRKTRAPKTASQLVDTHMKDPNHVITDEDLKSVTIDTTLPQDGAHQPLEIKPDDERPKDEDKDHRFKTPWDVLDE